jgi:hypothetical protein
MLFIISLLTEWSLMQIVINIILSLNILFGGNDCTIQYKGQYSYKEAVLNIFKSLCTTLSLDKIEEL